MAYLENPQKGNLWNKVIFAGTQKGERAGLTVLLKGLLTSDSHALLIIKQMSPSFQYVPGLN